MSFFRRWFRSARKEPWAATLRVVQEKQALVVLSEVVQGDLVVFSSVVKKEPWVAVPHDVATTSNHTLPRQKNINTTDSHNPLFEQSANSIKNTKHGRFAHFLSGKEVPP